MKKIFLHIGFHKTATTYIQSALRLNRSLLESRGYRYYLDSRYHSKGYANHTLPLSIRTQQHPVVTIPESGDQVWQRFIDVVESSDIENTIVSSEVFMEGVDREFIARALGKHHVRLIIYLRNQVNALESTYVEQVKHGYSGSPEDLYNGPHTSNLDYYRQIKTWADTFNPGDMIIRSYDKVAAKGGNIFPDYLEAIGVPFSGINEFSLPSHRSNRRYPAELTEVMKAYSSIPIPTSEKVRFKQYLDHLLESNKAVSELPPFTIPRELRQRIMQEFSASNEQLSREFMDGERLFPEDPDSSTPGLSRKKDTH